MNSQSNWNGNVVGCLLVCLLLAAGLLEAAELHVSPGGKPDGDGSQSKPLDVFTALGTNSPAKPGDTILLLGGTYEGKMDGIKRVPFAWAVSGTVEKPVVIKPAPGASVHLNGTATLSSSHAHYIGIEVGDLQWDIHQKNHQNETALWAISGEGAKVINCNFFGGSMGTGLWSPCKNLTVYGCLVHDFGFVADAGRGQGHAFYAQNETGTKTIEGNIAWRGCGWNLHVYTQTGQIIGFDVIDNIMYIAGSRADDPQTMDNYLVAGYHPADRIRLIGNVGYQPNMAQEFRPNVRLSYYKTAVNQTGVAVNNYFAGAPFGLSVGEWKSMTLTNNTLWASRVLIEINSNSTGTGNRPRDHKPDPKNYRIDNNTYLLPASDKAFRYASQEPLLPGELLTFGDWQNIGFDKNSKVVPGKNGKPTGTKVFVFPNKYEKGRANVGVFNWDGLDKVAVDLSGALNKGQSFAIYNCLDITQTIALSKPVVTGKYDGGAVEIPMRKDRISPDFDAFLVLPRP